MKSSSLESKTVRPGLGLDNYTAFYKSNGSKKSSGKKSSDSKPSSKSKSRILKAIALVVAVTIVGLYINANNKPVTKTQATVVLKEKSTSKTPTKSKPAAVTPAAPALAANSSKPCAGNALNKLALVSISKRHMWACEGNKSVHDSPVITGMQTLAADLTPPGTYSIYAKQKDVTLTGTDSTGSWNDPVSYWMPFLINEYGTYGFHDATWRPDSDFGNIDPNSMDGSHGCVELPLSDSEWLYNWSPTGTTVTIKA